MAKDIDYEALKYHSNGRPGKIEVVPTKEYKTAEELALAYSPGVAAPAKGISKDRWNAYKYTNKGNLVAVISNGSSLLGLGNRGALASKPVMEGKAMLFKVYADIDAFDIEIAEEEPEKFIEIVQAMAPTFGAINLEDIKAPECFYIEKRLRTLLGIPVMHDDQHGTAVAVAAALTNALYIAKKDIACTRIVISGAGAAAISTARILSRRGATKENIIMFDSRGAITTRRNNLTAEKKEFAVENNVNTLSEALQGADIFIGLSVGNILDGESISKMADTPIIFALSNPTPEIDYNTALLSRPDAIVATGRSDYPNQINNVLAFPYLFRGALDVLATTINDAMEQAAIDAISSLARSSQQSNRKNERFGKENIIPHPGDPRLIAEVSCAVAKAAIESGVARRNINDWKQYRRELLIRKEREFKFGHQKREKGNKNNLRRRYSIPMHKL